MNNNCNKNWHLPSVEQFCTKGLVNIMVKILTSGSPKGIYKTIG